MFTDYYSLFGDESGENDGSDIDFEGFTDEEKEEEGSESEENDGEDDENSNESSGEILKRKRLEEKS